MPQLIYNAIEVQQQPDAAPFYLIKANAEELLLWSDVPRKKADFLAGYQRDLEQRQETIKTFIKKSPLNILPGAIIVAVDSNAVAVSSTALTDVRQITVTYDASGDFRTQLTTIYNAFHSRLSPEELAAITNSDQADAENDQEEQEEPVGPPPSYLAVLTRELKQAVDDFSSLPPERQSAVIDYVNSAAKPGAILDGQHRVFGAKNVAEFDVILPVVLIPGLTSREQAFHFFVLNNKAKPLTPTQLRSVLSTSLTRQEIDDLWERFEQAGVKPHKASWTHRINTDPDSPFLGLLDFGLGEATSFIPESVMFQIVNDFMTKTSGKFKLLTESVPEWENEDYKMRCFFTLWQAVKQNYATVWDLGVSEKKGQIFQKVSLLILQELLLETAARGIPRRSVEGQPSPFADPSDLKKEVEATLYYLPAEFFTRAWQIKQLDTSDGRSFFKEQMDKAISNLGKNIGNLKLFKVASGN